MARAGENAYIRPWGATSAEIAGSSLVPLVQELVLETDTRRIKVGDGSTTVASLPYWCEQSLFSSIAVAGQTTVTANSITTTLTLAAGANITLTTNNTTKTITIAATSGGGATVTDGDYGDITVSSTGTVWTIDPAAVTLAKMADLAQDQFIGRVTASTGVPETATITAAARTVLDDTTVASMVNTLGGATSTGTGGLARSTSPVFTTSILPVSNDGASIGISGTAFSDAFFASGAVINFDAGDVTLTHSANAITLAGGDLALGGNSLTLTGSIAATGSRVTKGWYTNLEITNAPTVSGSPVYYTGGPDVALADGGTGASLSAPGSDSIFFYDASATSSAFLSIGSGLSITGTTLTATGLGGTVTSVSVVTANGVSGGVATATTTPAITLTLGAITPTTVNGNTLTTGTGTLTLSTFTLTVAGTASITGTNTGDQTITLTSDVTGSGTGSFATTIANNAVTLAKMAQVATATFLGRTTASTGNVEALTVTQATALLNVFGPDSGSGGVKGLAPATVSGDAVKFLRGDGTWAAVSGASGGTVTSVSVVTANGVSGSVATATTTPAITLTLGAITPTSVNGLTITTTTGTLTIASGKTATVSNTLTFTGTDASSVAFGTGGTVLYTSAIGVTVQAWDTQLDSLAALTYPSNALKVIRVNAGATAFELATPTTGTVTSVAIAVSDGITLVSGSPITGSGTITLGLDNITVDTINGVTLDASSGRIIVGNTFTLTVSNTANVSNTNSGDQLYTASGDATAPSSASNLVLTLATVATAGTTGGSTEIPVITIDAKGRTTSIATAVVIAPAGTLTGATLAAGVTASSLQSVATIGTGVWQGTIIQPTYGGTGSNLSTTGGASHVLKQSSTGAAITVGQLAASDLSNGTSGSGSVALTTSPVLTTPNIGAATASSITGDGSLFLRTGTTSGDSVSIQAWNGFTGTYKTFFSLVTFGATQVADLDTAVTIAGNYIYRVGGNDVSVPDGGTGVSSHTAFAVLCGGTTSTGAIQSVASVGTAGQVLTSNGAGALPTFQASAAGDFFGPAGATNNAVVLFDTTTGKLGKNSTLTIHPTTGVAVLGGSAASFKIGDSTAGILQFRDSTGADLTITAGSNVLTLSGTASISATAFIGTLFGNASTASLLQTTRSIYGNNFNGGGDIVVPVPLGFGGTGTALSDPNADRILFWDDSAGAVTWLAPAFGSLEITGTTLDLPDKITAGTSNAAHTRPILVWDAKGRLTSVGGTNITAIAELLIGNAVLVTHGGTGIMSVTANGLIAGGTTSTGNFVSVATGTRNQFLVSRGTAAPPVMATLYDILTDSSSPPVSDAANATFQVLVKKADNTLAWHTPGAC